MTGSPRRFHKSDECSPRIDGNITDLREPPTDTTPCSSRESEPYVVMSKGRSIRVLGWFDLECGRTHKFPYIPNGVSAFSPKDSSHLSGRNTIASGPHTSGFLYSRC